MKRLLCLVALLAAAPAQSQMYKCTNPAGRITYSSEECGKIGLKSAGEVRDSVTVVPAGPVSKPQPPSPPAPPAAIQSPAAQAEPPKEPERRCFTVKTAKGVVTRCNDKPEE